MRRRPFHGDPPKREITWLNAQPIWIAALSLCAILLTIGQFWVLPSMQQPKVKKVKPVVSAEIREKVMEQVHGVLTTYLVQDDWIRDQGDHIEVQVPRKLNFLKLYGDIEQSVQNGLVTTSCKETGETNYMLDVRYKDANVCRFLFKRQKPLGYVAIIIDDFGYNYNDLAREFLRFRYPITVSIIPGLQDSRTVGREASLLNKEVLVHMPMKPEDAAYNDNGYLLYPGQDNSAVRMRLRQAFSQLPNAVGINNHQGSLATTDPELMRTVMGELKLSDKFFVDSFTTPKTIGYKTAKKMGVKTVENKMFIDAKYEQDFMLSQFDRITEMALAGQSVVAIGHVRRKTLDILERKIPELDEKGIEFVSVSKLVN